MWIEMPSDTAQLVLFPSHWEYIIFTMAQLQSTTILCSHTVMLLCSTRLHSLLYVQTNSICWSTRSTSTERHSTWLTMYSQSLAVGADVWGQLQWLTTSKELQEQVWWMLLHLCRPSSTKLLATISSSYIWHLCFLFKQILKCYLFTHLFS